MKILKRILLSLIIIAVIAITAFLFWGGHMIKHSVNTMGEKALGTSVTLEHARLHPLRGYISLKGLVVGNPKGFKTESLFEMKQLEIKMNMGSLFSDPIIIEQILIDSPQITYEVGLRNTNIGALLDNTGDKKPKESASPKETKKKDAGKTIIIKELKIIDARAQVSATALEGRVIPVQLSTITLNNLGGPDQNVSQITAEILQAILSALKNAGAGDIAGEGLKAVLDTANALGEQATDGVKTLLETTEEGTRVVTDTINSKLDKLQNIRRGTDASKPQNISGEIK